MLANLLIFSNATSGWFILFRKYFHMKTIFYKYAFFSAFKVLFLHLNL